MECHSQMLSAEINVSVKIKIEINVFVAEKPFIGEFFFVGENSRKRKVTKFHTQIRHFSANIRLTVKSTEIAGNIFKNSDLQNSSPLNSESCPYATRIR